MTFDSACRQEVLPGCILGCTSMSRPQLTLTPQGSLLLLCTVGSREWRALEWWDFESLNPALSNIQVYVQYPSLVSETHLVQAGIEVGSS